MSHTVIVALISTGASVAVSVTALIIQHFRILRRLERKAK